METELLKIFGSLIAAIIIAYMFLSLGIMISFFGKNMKIARAYKKLKSGGVSTVKFFSDGAIFLETGYPPEKSTILLSPNYYPIYYRLIDEEDSTDNAKNFSIFNVNLLNMVEFYYIKKFRKIYEKVQSFKDAGVRFDSVYINDRGIPFILPSNKMMLCSFKFLK